MKRIVIGLLSGIIFLTACGQNSSAIPTVSISIVDTATPSPIPVNTNTSLPSATLTASITPLPTIPTFTPTFDARTIVTVSPAPKAECPISKPIQNLNFDFLNVTPGIELDNRAKAEENILSFLDSYGAQPLVAHLRNSWGIEGKDFLYEDLTNDSVPELAIGLTAFYIFGCKNGRYEKIFELPPDGRLIPPHILFTKDNNRNGLPELTLLIGTWSQGGRAYQIYEWNGTQFHNLVLPDDPNYPDLAELWVEAMNGGIFYQDLNHAKVNEIILNSGVPDWTIYFEGLPWRNKQTIYQWNGKNYVPMHFEFATPEFRFQAIQDGDLATNQFEFDKALSLYQDAIFSDKLKYYSADIRKNLQDNWMAQVGNVRPTPTPYPPDLTEYPRLAVYAYYRIILLHLVQGHESDATTVYNTLQQKFGNDQYGHPFVEMATAFWEAYQSMHKMYDGCAAAIQYTAEHPEILTPLGSDYHGWQSHIYVPADVCPFR